MFCQATAVFVALSTGITAQVRGRLFAFPLDQVGALARSAVSSLCADRLGRRRGIFIV